MKRYDFAGKTVLITGASMGIGEVFARELSRRGAKLVLVARSEAKLQALAKELGNAQVIAADLLQSGAATRLYEAVVARGLEIDVLVNNAGFGAHGDFTDVSLANSREQVDLNCGALVELTHVFMPMIEKRQGGVLQVASTAAFQPVPYMAVYGATKAFVLSFGEALWAEYRGRGVRVTTLCPGATETPFFARSGEEAAVGAKADPLDVVRDGLNAFVRGRASVISGFMNFVLAFTSRFASREMTARIAMLVVNKPKKHAQLPAGSRRAA